MAKKQATGLHYVGQEFIVGVPARNLTAEEAALYAAQINENEIATGRALYAPIIVAESIVSATAPEDGEKHA